MRQCKTLIFILMAITTNLANAELFAEASFLTSPQAFNFTSQTSKSIVHNSSTKRYGCRGRSCGLK